MTEFAIDPKYPSPPVVNGLTVLDARATPLVDLDLAVGTVGAFRFIFEKEPSRECICCLCSQMILETGRIHCYRYNITNIKASPSYRGMVQYYPCSEIINGVERHYTLYHPTACFRAWLKLGQGIEQHLRFIGTSTNTMGRPNRYQRAFDAAVAGDPLAMVDGFADAGFFTANRALYKSGTKRIYDELMRKLPTELPLGAIETAVVAHEHEPLTLQPTTGRAMFTDADLRRIASLQIPLTINWEEWSEEVKRTSLEEDLPP